MRDEEHLTGDWRKGDPCYKVAETLATWCPSVLYNVELVSNDLG